MVIPTGLLLCSGIGLVISLYFTLVTYRLMSPDQRFIPKFCRMADNACAAIVDTPQARLLGVPNSLLGIVYYIGVILSVTSSFRTSTFLYAGEIGISVATIVMGGYLVHSLRRVLKVSCVLCMTGHLVNACILVLLIAGLFD
jgi:uncharacterized membrane protein